MNEEYDIRYLKLKDKRWYSLTDIARWLTSKGVFDGPDREREFVIEMVQSISASISRCEIARYKDDNCMLCISPGDTFISDGDLWRIVGVLLLDTEEKEKIKKLKLIPALEQIISTDPNYQEVRDRLIEVTWWQS